MRYVRVEWDGQLREARLEEWTEEGALEVTWLDRPLVASEPAKYATF